MFPADSTPSPFSPNASSSRRITVGALIGPYRLQEALGQGAMGAVFRAQDTRFGRDVAIKVILERKLSEKARARFRREAAALASLRHPAIIAVHDMGEDRGRHYLVLELISGARPLEHVLPQLTRTEAVEMVLEIARALGHAHSRGIVHRDVKPSNILVGEDKRPYLTDFGLVTGGRFDELERLTLSGAIVGTPVYMAPEQVSADRERVGPATDVWALGVVLYEALTGLQPFRADNFPELMLRISQATYTRPRRVDRSITPALAHVIEQALQPDPSQRLPNGAALAEAISAALHPSSTRAGTTLGVGVIAALATTALSLLLAIGAVLWVASRPPALPPPGPEATTLPQTDPAVVQVAHAGRAADGSATRGAFYALLLQGEALRVEGRLSAAREVCERALRIDPDSSEALNGLGIVVLSQGRLLRAEELLRRATQLEPSQPMPWHNLSVVYARRSDFETARAVLDEGIEQAPHELLFESRSTLREREGDITGAIEDVSAGLRLRPNRVGWLIRRAKLRKRLDQISLVLFDVERALDAGPTTGEEFDTLFGLAHAAGATRLAQRALEGTLRIDPQQARAWNTLAVIKEEGGDLEGAMADYDRAVAVDEEDAAVRYNRGELRYRMGRLVEALEDLRVSARLLDPEEVKAHAGIASMIAEIEAKLGR